jgi:uncharacterized protein (TIGR03435 family)
MIPLIMLIAWVQQPWPATPPEFDAASVKEVEPGNLTPSAFAPTLITADPGRLSAQSVSIGALIAYAYDVPPSHIVGLKSGMGIYDVEGRPMARTRQRSCA